ncbi:hypothetical protein ACFFX0_28540 [Citricoccus parietis]|uniref:Uncharacterized protein n=1 Tax=Citricoccus parietis TaxID=592307 RepID=A0ABV5G7J9_9MICC
MPSPSRSAGARSETAASEVKLSTAPPPAFPAEVPAPLTVDTAGVDQVVVSGIGSGSIPSSVSAA